MERPDTILQHLGISQLNRMQEETMDAILHTDNDVVVLSPTGSGKTLAYMLPLSQRLKKDIKVIQAIVVVPGRELALQSAEVMKKMKTGLLSMAVYGGHSTMDEHRRICKIRPNILFGTPGRINDHIDKENFQTSSVKWLIIDEFDKCLEMGFQKEMAHLVKHLPNIERRILLSATESELIPKFVNMGQKRIIDYREKNEQISERVKVFQIISQTKDKLQTLEQTLLTMGNESTVVFQNHRESVERTAEYLAKKGFSVITFHGGLEQKEREAALFRFTNGSANILVCTDLASRGLDIPNIQNIIHYHLPETKQNYIHRVGRTARWDRVGRTFFLLNKEEEIPEYVEEKTQVFEPQKTDGLLPAQPRMQTLYIGKGKKDKISKGDIVGFLCKKGEVRIQDIGIISVLDRYTYVAVKGTITKHLIKKIQGKKIKGLKTIVEPVKF